ncbi:MAG: P-loop NTPase fold protein, partial [Candidatus Bipolaricaulota bacterium]
MAFLSLYFASYMRPQVAYEGVAQGPPGDPDAPVCHPDQDSLWRAPIAHRVYQSVAGTPPEQTRVVAVYGEWGAGKTSTMRMVAHYCHRAGHLTVWYDPWRYRDEREAWQGLVSSLGDVLDDLSDGFSTRHLWKLTRLLRNRAVLLHPTARLLLDILANAGEEMNEGTLHRAKRRIGGELKSLLGNDGRLVVFIDDLDRCTPDLSRRLLMSISEVLDLPRCAYVIGLRRFCGDSARRKYAGTCCISRGWSRRSSP